MSRKSTIHSALDEIEAGIEIMKENPSARVEVQSFMRKQKAILKSVHFTGKMPRLPRNYAKRVEA